MDGRVHNIEKWDLVIAHPPCTYLSNAGACRLYPKKGELNLERYINGLKAKSFFMTFYLYGFFGCGKIAIENPLPSSIYELPEKTQVIHPYQFDEFNEHPYTKKTLIWLFGLPDLKHTTPDRVPIGTYIPSGTGRKNKDTYGFAKRGDDSKNRSKSFPGIAKAMADQWG